MLTTEKKSMLGTMAGLALLMSGVVLAASGDLDPSFGTGGKVVTDFGSVSETALDVVVQRDGKIVVVGETNNETTFNNDIVLARYNSDGSPDLSFGTGGKVTTDSGDSDSGIAVAMQTDGKIVIAASYGNAPAVIRYLSNGTLDKYFGSGGVAVLGSFATRIVDLAIQSDNKIVTVGTDFNASGDFFVARLNSNGRIDTRFGSRGTVVTDFSGFEDSASGVALQTDGKIVVAGYASTNGINAADIALARYTANGRLDAGFGNGGKVTTDFGKKESASKVVVQRDGKIVVAGVSGDEGPFGGVENGDFLLVRYRSNGALDTSFGQQGKTLTDFDGNEDYAYDIKIDRNGRFAVAGSSWDPAAGALRFAVARYLLNGAPDLTFGAGGRVTTSFDTEYDNAQAYAVAVQSDGKIIAAGYAWTVAGGSDFAIARYLP